MLETTNGRGQDPVVGGEKKDLLPDKTDAEMYEKLLQEYDSKFGTLSEGEIVRGRVIKVTGGEVIVDVGQKSEGIVPISEFVGPDGSSISPSQASPRGRPGPPGRRTHTGAGLPQRLPHTGR